MGAQMKTPIAQALFRWRRSSLAETDARDLVSAPCYRGPEHVGIAAVVVAKLKLSDVERQIFGTHLVERANDAALKDAPKTFNRIGVNSADNVLLVTVLHSLARIFLQAPINLVFVRRQQADFIGHGLADKLFDVLLVHVIEQAGDDVALPLYCADDRQLAGSSSATFAMVPLVPVAVVILAANPRLVHFDDAAKLSFRRDQRGADFVAHAVRRLIAAKAHETLDLKCAHSLLAGQHQMRHAKPVAKRLLSVLKNGACKGRKPVTLRRASPALPMEGFVAGRIVEVGISAARAMDPFRPSPSDQIGKARLVVTNRKTGLKLGRRHLRDGLWTPCHDSVSPYVACRKILHNREGFVKWQIIASPQALMR